MRPVEERFIRSRAAEKRAAIEHHRLRYVYFLNRLEDVLRMTDSQRAGISNEVREIARACRAERAAYLQMTEAEADHEHGTVLDVARGLITTNPRS